MKFTWLGLGLLSCSSFLMYSSFLTNSASAQCVQTDVSVQYTISDSGKRPKRSNDVDFDSDPGCSGNASVTTGVQGNIGSNRVEQNRRVRHRQQGGNGNGTGINGPTIQHNVNVEIDVRNPAAQYVKVISE